MDRNCSDANLALSVLETAVRKAELFSRESSENLLKKESDSTMSSEMAELEKMENDRRSASLLSYTSSLTTFLKDVGMAVTSIRSGQSVIQNILRMNSLALESANTHKMTGIANTADAVTIIIGSIIDVCNRAASQALTDGLSKMRVMAQEGTERLATGTYESIRMQNEELQNFVDSVRDLKEMTTTITANSVDLLKQQFDVINSMREESGALADATEEAQRSMFAARAGIIDGQSVPANKHDDPPETRLVGLRIHETH